MKKDEQYFDDSTYIFINSELKDIIKKLSKEINVPIYAIIDESVRKNLENYSIVFDKQPKILKFVEQTEPLLGEK